MGSRESFAMSIPGLSLAPKENSVEIPRRCRPAFTRLLAEVIFFKLPLFDGFWWFLRKRFLAMCHHVPCYPYLSMLTTHSQSSCCLGVVQSENCYSPKKNSSTGLPHMPRCCNSLSRRTSLKIPAAPRNPETHGETFGTEMGNGKEWIES